MPIAANSLNHYAGPWTDTQLRHLLRRTLIGVTVADHSFFAGKNLDQCLDLLFQPLQAPCPPLFSSDEDEGMIRETNTFVFARENDEDVDDRLALLRAWWASQMLEPQTNISEKMVMFWHNHFAVEFKKVRDSRYSYQYLATLRQHATGNFKTLLKEITINPCMLVYLNGTLNNKSAPNENYGRELQELFTVGKGPESKYTESDVKAAARVLSGWKEHHLRIEAYFQADDHDTGDKVFSAFYNNYKIAGRQGDEGAKEVDELIDMICRNKEVSKFLCRKLYRWFVNSTINEQVEKNVILPMSNLLMQSNYEIKPVLKAMLGAAFFYEPALTGSMIKSPVDYLGGIAREFIIDYPDRKNRYRAWGFLAALFEILGQNIGDPPNVAGWPAYYEYPLYDKNWINSEGFYFRNQVIRFFCYLDNEADHPIEISFLGFVYRLSAPGDPAALVSETLRLLSTVPPGASQSTYLQKLLEPGHSGGQTWSALWSAHMAAPADDGPKAEVNKRLRKVFGAILISPEFQIM